MNTTMMETKSCWNEACQRTNPPDAQYCRACGVAFDDDPLRDHVRIADENQEDFLYVAGALSVGLMALIWMLC